MRSSIKKLLSEPPTFGQIVSEFKQLASSSALGTRAQNKFSELVLLSEQMPLHEEHWSAAAEELGFREFCEGLPDQEIAQYLALPLDGQPDKLSELVRSKLFEPNRATIEKQPGWNEDKFVGHFCGIFRTALLNEYRKRRDRNESEDGRVMREVIVREDERGEILQGASEALIPGLFFPGEHRGRSEEAPAEARLQIWKAICEFAHVSPAAANPAALEAFMSGRFNNVLEQSRLAVRTVVETQTRRESRRDPGPAPEREPQETKVLLEMARSKPQEQEQKLLVEEVLSAAQLQKSDRKLFERYVLEGMTQEDLANELRVSQPQVCKRLRAVRAALAGVITRTKPSKFPDRT
jgi:RNA polymerase sigma factor (sigma-70 family)